MSEPKVRIAHAGFGGGYWVEVFSPQSGEWKDAGGEFFWFHWTAKRYAREVKAGLVPTPITYEII